MMGGGNSDDIVSGEVIGETTNEEEGNNTETNDSMYYFSFETGACRDEDGNEGYYFGELKECGSFQDDTLSEANLKDKTLYGLNLKGTQVLNSKVSFGNIADREMKVDDKTYFEKKKNAFTSLYDQHLNIYKRESNKAQKYNKKITKLNQTLEKQKANYIKFLDQGKDEKAAKVEKQILKSNDSISKNTDLANKALAKKDRHMQYALALYPIALEEPAYTDPKIKNKKWTTFENKFFLEGEASNAYFATNNFTISVWFRTIENQNDGRMVNFRMPNGGTAINLSLKKNTIISGYRNANGNYIELKKSQAYTDNSWRNVVVTYNDDTFKLYVDGELAVENQDTFSGFGDVTLKVGSYDGNGSFYNGDLDELSFWDESLDADSIHAIYHNGIPTNLKRHLSANNLLYWWRLGDKKKDKHDYYGDLVKKAKLQVRP